MRTVKFFGQVCAPVVFVAGFLVLNACRESIPAPAATGAGTPSTGGLGGTGTSVVDPPKGVVDDAAGFYVRVYQGDKIAYYEHLEGTDFTAPCKIAVGETADAKLDIKCYIEVPEEDLYFYGLKMQVNVPSKMCNYVAVYPYFFQNWKIGYGPSAISYDVDQLGSIVNLTVTPAGSGGLNGTTPTCTYDYSGSDSPGPNCCLGHYVVTSRVWDATLATPGYGSPSVTKGDWGGNASSCIAGPAVDTQPKTKDGFPKAVAYFVEDVGLNTTYEPPVPQSKDVGPIYLANFYDTAVYTSGPPPALATYAHPDYLFECSDRGDEVKARIRVYVRKWSEYAQWKLGSAGNPETTGNETSFQQGPLNDYFSWDNYKNLGDPYPHISN